MIEHPTRPARTQLTSRQTCLPAEWQQTSYPAGWQQPSYWTADDFYKGETSYGNGVDALPYQFEKVQIINPDWDFKAEMGQPNWPCSQAQTVWESDGSLLTSIDYSVLTYDFPLATREFVDSIAIVKAQADLRSAMANVPMLFIERRSTVATAARYTTALLASVRRLQREAVAEWMRTITKHKNRNKRKAVAQAIANRHLEFVFGVLPLLRDIEGSLEFLNQEETIVRTGRGRMSETFDPFPSVRIFPQGARKTMTVKNKYSVRTGLRCDITSSIANNISLLGFNPLYTWYDFTPLSFVLGWVSNFNFWLQSLDPTVGLAYRTGYSSKRTECQVTVDVENHRVGADYYWEGISDEQSSSAQRIRQIRVVHPTMPPLQELAFYDNTSLFAFFAGLSLTVQRAISLTRTEIGRKEFRYRSKRSPTLPPIRYRKG